MMSGLLELRARASYLRAEALLPLAGLMPQKDIRERLRDIAPTGEWMDMRLQLVRGQVSVSLETAGQRADFATSASRRSVARPGLRGLTASLAGDESGGRARDRNPNGGVYLARPVSPADRSDPCSRSTLYWKRTAEEFLVATTDLQLECPRRQRAWPSRLAATERRQLADLVAGEHRGRVAIVSGCRIYSCRANSSRPLRSRGSTARSLPGAYRMPTSSFKGPCGIFRSATAAACFWRAAIIDGMTLGLSRRLAARRGSGRRSRISQRRDDRAALERPHRRPHRGFRRMRASSISRTASCRFMRPLHGDAADALQFLRATPLDAMTEHAFSAVEAQGNSKSTVNLFLPFKAVRSSPGVGACRL